jgi:hypothetical protein
MCFACFYQFLNPFLQVSWKSFKASRALGFYIVDPRFSNARQFSTFRSLRFVVSQSMALQFIFFFHCLGDCRSLGRDLVASPPTCDPSLRWALNIAEFSFKPGLVPIQIWFDLFSGLILCFGHVPLQTWFRFLQKRLVVLPTPLNLALRAGF